MWTSYSTRHAAQLIGLPESAVRACIREGLVGTAGQVPAQLTFRDLSALRTVKALVDAGLPIARVRRELLKISRAMGASIAELAIEAREGRLHVRGEPYPDDQLAQLTLPLEGEPGSVAGQMRELVRPRVQDREASTRAIPDSVDEWLERALELESQDPRAAIEAYRRALVILPECTEAWTNLGRLYAESNDPVAARDCFSQTLRLDGEDATAFYNLGVLAQDAGNEAEAIALYRRALELDPSLAEAHYNLATLFDQTGDGRAAIRHINEYRKLTR